MISSSQKTQEENLRKIKICSSESTKSKLLRVIIGKHSLDQISLDLFT
jgi:hypothetical protein